MRWNTVATLLFVLYCVEVGVFLLVSPWTATWDRLVIGVPSRLLHDVYLNASFRGAVSGFGVVHILWGAHDLELWLARRERKGDSVDRRESVG
jgi:hypothetical protein